MAKKRQEQKKQGRADKARLRAVHPVGFPDGTRAEPGEEFVVDAALADRLGKKGAAELVAEEKGGDDDGQTKGDGQQAPQGSGQDGEGKDGEGGEG